VREVASQLIEYDCVTYVGCSIGDTDLGIQVVAKTNEDLYAFITDVVGNIPGVQKTTTMIVPIIMKDIYQWHIPGSD
jgi:DNA-binding Lrp family transcriptional regulator